MPPPKVLVMAKNEGVTAAIRGGQAARLKLEIRRLPPGLTEAEFEAILGDEWRLGHGKVDWQEYRRGKGGSSSSSEKMGKLPEHSRCYVHLVHEAVIPDFEATFKAITAQDGWKDKAGTYRNPPVIGFAPNQRTTLHTKPRSDNRQGTIDQEPDFQAFLEEQTQAIARPAPIDSASLDHEKPEKVVVRTTPLIEHIREKKANKAKAAESSKGDKKDGKGHARNESKSDVVPEKPAKEIKSQPAKEMRNQGTMKEPKNQQQKVEQASKDAVKAVNKQVASKQQQNQQIPASPQQPASKNQANQPQAKGKKTSPSAAQSARAPQTAQITKIQNSTPTKPTAIAQSPKAAAPGDVGGGIGGKQPTPRAPRQRGSADGAKKMLQKDLAAIQSKNTPTAAAKRPATPSTSMKPTAASDRPATPNMTPAPASSSLPPPISGPAHVLQKQTRKPPTAPKAQSQPKQQPHQQQPSNTGSTTKAYLKHANPSQGMSDNLIQQVLSQFGEVTKVAIDPRKGTAIASFKDPEGLKKALAAKKVPVANGSVEILEWKDRPAGNSGGSRSGGSRGGRGGAGARGGRGGNAGVAANTAPAAIQAPKAESGPQAVSVS